MGHLLPQIPRSPAHRVFHPVVFGDVAPAAPSALRAEQLLQPFIAEYQHRVSLDHQLGPSVAHAPFPQLLRREQVEVILLAIALDSLLWMGWAEQLTPMGPTFPAVSPGISGSFFVVQACAEEATHYSQLGIVSKKKPHLSRRGIEVIEGRAQAEPTPTYEP